MQRTRAYRFVSLSLPYPLNHMIFRHCFVNISEELGGRKAADCGAAGADEGAV